MSLVEKYGLSLQEFYASSILDAAKQDIEDDNQQAIFEALEDEYNLKHSILDIDNEKFEIREDYCERLQYEFDIELQSNIETRVEQYLKQYLPNTGDQLIPVPVEYDLLKAELVSNVLQLLEQKPE